MATDQEPRSLAQLSRIRQDLARAGTLEEFTQIRDVAVAFRAYTKARSEGIEIQNEGAEIVLRAERQADELIAQMEKAKGAGLGKPETRGLRFLACKREGSRRFNQNAGSASPPCRGRRSRRMWRR